MGDENQAKLKIPPTAAPNFNGVSSQVSGEKSNRLTSIASTRSVTQESSTKPSILKRSSSLSLVNNSRREISSDPVAAANEMWAKEDAAEAQIEPAISTSRARQDEGFKLGDDKVHLRLKNGPSTIALRGSSIVVRADIHEADKISKVTDETRSDEGVYTTAREAQVPSDDRKEERHPQNQEVIDLSEQEVHFGKKVTNGSESQESTLVSDSLINQIKSWQTTKVSEPMSYRTKTDTYDSEQESDKEKDSYDIYD